MIISLRTSENLNTFSYLYYYNLHTLRGNTINMLQARNKLNKFIIKNDQILVKRKSKNIYISKKIQFLPFKKKATV